jgi:hypothetical protein
MEEEMDKKKWTGKCGGHLWKDRIAFGAVTLRVKLHGVQLSLQFQILLPGHLQINSTCIIGRKKGNLTKSDKKNLHAFLLSKVAVLICDALLANSFAFHA